MDEAEPGADGVATWVAWVNKLRFHVGMGSNGGYTHVSCVFYILIGGLEQFLFS